MYYLQESDFTIVSNSAVNENFPMWDSTKEDYAVADTVEYLNKLWKVVIANTRKEPSIENSDSVFFKTVNKLMFADEFVNTQTTANGSLVIEITTKSITAISLLNVEAKTVLIEQLDADGNVLKELSEEMRVREVRSWLDYWFNRRTKSKTIFNFDANIAFSQRFRITLTGATVKLGVLLCGKKISLGCTSYGASFGIVDYSRVTTDDFGNTEISIRNFAKKIDIDVIVNNVNFDTVNRDLEKLRSKATLYYGALNKYESFTVYGHYKNFTNVISSEVISKCSIDILGVI